MWVQAWTDNDYLNLRALFDIISSSGRSPEELFLRSGNSPASVCPSANISCYRISSKTTGRMFLKLGQNVPLGVQLCKYWKEFRSVNKLGRRRPSLICLVIASPHKLLDGFMRTYYRCEKFVRVLHNGEGFARICHICEQLARIFHRCDNNVRFFHTCDRFVWLSHSNESVTGVKNSRVFCHTWKIRTNSSQVWQIRANSSHVYN